VIVGDIGFRCSNGCPMSWDEDQKDSPKTAHESQVEDGLLLPSTAFGWLPYLIGQIPPWLSAGSGRSCVFYRLLTLFLPQLNA